MSENYGERLAEVRDTLGLTQEEFAAGAGIPVRTLQDIENGKVARPQRKTRQKIDAYLGLHSEGEVPREWPPDVDAFTKMVGAFLTALESGERQALMDEMIRQLAHRSRLS